jgi:hypothetical protein
MSNAAAKTRSGRKPSHHVYVVDGEGEGAFFTKIGAAWPTKKGTGFTVKLTATPINGRLVMTEVDQEPKAA